MIGIHAPARAQIPSRNLQVLANRNEYPPPAGQYGYSSCWSYIHPDGREYAAIGTRNGTAIYNVTDPAATHRVAFVPGPSSKWREMKSYRSWIYVVTEGEGPTPLPGVQIIRMTDPEHPLLVATWTGTFNHCHTVTVDTSRALLVCNGARNSSGIETGMHIVSIANPESPVELSVWPGWLLMSSVDSFYVHDSFPVGNRLYACSIYPGIVRTLDVSDPAHPLETHELAYRGGFAHNCWTDTSGRYLYVTDEVKGEPLKVFDVANVASPVEVNAITSNPEAIVHNAYVTGDQLAIANYTEGARVLDVSDPAHPAEFAWADTWPSADGPFNGVWGVCPFFPSGTLIASDMQSGLYVMRPVRNYGLESVRVVDAATLSPIAGAMVTLTSQGDSLLTPDDGMVRFAPSPGSHAVFARKFGYQAAAASFAVSLGGRDSITLALDPFPGASLVGTVRDASTHAALDQADVLLDGAPIHETSDGSGSYALADVPDDVYRVEVHRPGYAPLSIERRIGPGFDGTQGFALNPARTWDALETESGWTIGAPGDNATSGVWVRGDPVGTGGTGAEACPCGCGAMMTVRRDAPLAEAAALAVDGTHAMSCCAHHESAGPAACPIGSCSASPDGKGCVAPAHDSRRAGSSTRSNARPETQSALYPLVVQPDHDRTPGAGTMCFFTGQGNDRDDIWQNEVNGVTTLTSPALDLTGMSDPSIGYWRWFYSDGDRHDWFAVSISNDGGTTWVAVDTTRGRLNEWEEQTIRIADHVTPTNAIKVRFTAADLGAESIVEAAIDDITTFDAAIPVTSVPSSIPSRLAFRAPSPNPARGAVTLTLDVPRAANVRVEVLDLAGRRVRTLWRGPIPQGTRALRWDGADEAGRPMRAGVYLVRASDGRDVISRRVVRAR